ncbi:MAG: ribonuclease P protein component [Candidatus Methylomirabilales bacterium]
MRHRFSRANRIRGTTEFQEVVRRGEKVSWKGLSLFIRHRPGTEIRLGLAVSRRIGGAVARNRMRRRLREYFRHNRSRMPKGLDLVVVVHRDLSEVDHKTFLAIVGDLFRRAGIIRHSPPQHAKELVHTHN